MASPTARHIRGGLGVLWLIDAALQAQPQLFSSSWWRDDLAESVMGQPAPISRSILWVTGHLAPHAAAANTAVIIIQAAIGLCLILGRHERAAIAVSIPWSLAVWSIGEGFGALTTGFAVLAGGAPGPVLLYPLIGLICWPGSTRCRAADRVRVGAARSAWVVLWVGAALAGLPWRFPAAVMLRANIEQNSVDQPHWLSATVQASYRTAGSHPVLVPALLFGAQLAVGAAVLSPRTRRYALGAGTALALLYWIIVQGLAGLASGTATDPGSVPLLVLLAVAVTSPSAPHRRRVDPRRGRAIGGRPLRGIRWPSSHIQTDRGNEHWAWSSISRTTRPERTVFASTTSTSPASPLSGSIRERCAACATCTTSNTTPSATCGISS